MTLKVSMIAFVILLTALELTWWVHGIAPPMRFLTMQLLDIPLASAALIGWFAFLNNVRT